MNNFEETRPQFVGDSVTSDAIESTLDSNPEKAKEQPEEQKAPEQLSVVEEKRTQLAPQQIQKQEQNRCVYDVYNRARFCSNCAACANSRLLTPNSNIVDLATTLERHGDFLSSVPIATDYEQFLVRSSFRRSPWDFLNGEKINPFTFKSKKHLHPNFVSCLEKLLEKGQNSCASVTFMCVSNLASDASFRLEEFVPFGKLSPKMKEAIASSLPGEVLTDEHIVAKFINQNFGAEKVREVVCVLKPRFFFNSANAEENKKRYAKACEGFANNLRKGVMFRVDHISNFRTDGRLFFNVVPASCPEIMKTQGITSRVFHDPLSCSKVDVINVLGPQRAKEIKDANGQQWINEKEFSKLQAKSFFANSEADCFVIMVNDNLKIAPSKKRK